MFFEEGKAWGRSRRLISPNLTGHNIASMIAIISKIAERFCARLGEKADAKEVVVGRDSFGEIPASCNGDGRGFPVLFGGLP
ncbi:unnamed protein product [Scytosiphon promiscuus]